MNTVNVTDIWVLRCVFASRNCCIFLSTYFFFFWCRNINSFDRKLFDKFPCNNFPLGQWCLTGVPWEFLKHVIPDYKVRALMFFPLVCQIKKSGSSQHNKSHSVWMNQNYAYFLSDRQNIYFGVPQKLVISLCVPSNEKGWKSLSQFKARQLSSWYVPFKTYYLNFTEKAAPDVKTQIQVYVF